MEDDKAHGREERRLSEETDPALELHKLEEQVRPGILVVDDDSRNLFAMAEVLRDDRQRVVVAHSGDDALRALLKDEFAVILLDIRMPGLDGYETAKLIRSREKTRSIPIIFLTGFNKENAEIAAGYSVGAVDYLLKPIDPAILKAKVAVFCDLHRKTVAARRYAQAAEALYKDRLRAERALDRRDEEQSLILRSLPIAIYRMPATDDYALPRFVRGHIAELTGFTADRFLNDGRFWWDHVHPGDRERVSGEFTRIRETGTVTAEYRWQCADGDYRHLLDQAVLIGGGHGKSDEIFGIWLDINEKRQLEDRLHRAQRLEALGLLAGGIVHDFNNLLTAIMGNLGRLEAMAGSDDRFATAIAAAQRAASHGENLVRQLLDFSQLRALQPETTDLIRHVQNVITMLQGAVGEAIAIEIDVQSELWPVRTDTRELELALLNIAANARDAMPIGGALRIGARNVTLTGGQPPGIAGDFVALRISDTGEGIAPDVLDRIFEPFFTTKPKGKGSGLGLSQVYGFAQQAGGSVDVESTVGSGTSVTLYLPRATIPRTPPMP
jgi:PAS domain S-box-containing protein